MASRVIPLQLSLVQPLSQGASTIKVPYSQLTFMGGLTVGDKLYMQLSRPGVTEVVSYVIDNLPTPDSQGNVTLPITRGEFGTPTASWGVGTCLTGTDMDQAICEACPAPELDAQALASLEALLPDMVGLQIAQALPGAVAAAVAAQVGQHVATAWAAMQPTIITNLTSAITPPVTQAVLAQIPLAVQAYLTDNLTNMVNDLMSAHPCCQACPDPEVIVPLCPPTTVAGQPYIGVIRVENVTDISALNLPAWATATLDATAGTITITGTPPSAESLSLLFNLTNACGGAVSYALNTNGGTLAVSAAPITVSCPEPTLTVGLSPQQVQVGQLYQGTFTVANATSLVMPALPAWLNFSFAQSTGVVTLTGTAPATGAEFDLTFTATNACPGAISNSAAGVFAGHLSAVTAALCPAPAVSQSIAPAAAMIGEPYTGTIVLANATTASVINLPVWASQSFSGNTITVTGTPNGSATLNLLVDAENACGTGTTSTLSSAAAGSLAVGALPACPMPSITAPLSPASVQSGQAYTGTIGFSNATAVTVQGLPSWATPTVDYATHIVTITGTAGATGVSGITLNMENTCAGGTPSTLNGAVAGNLTVGAVPVCTPPTILVPLSPTTATGGQAYNGQIILANATSAQVLGVPGWMTASYVPATGVITLTGVAPAGQTITLQVQMQNACAGGTPADATAAAGTLVIPCATPALATALTPTTAQFGVPYTGTATTTNATGVTVTGLPSWATATFDAGAQTVTITGTPDALGTMSPTITLENICGGGPSASAGPTAMGSVAVTAPNAPSGFGFTDPLGCSGAGIIINGTLSWAAVPGATSYEITWGVNPNTEPPPCDVGVKEPVGGWAGAVNVGNVTSATPFGGAGAIGASAFCNDGLNAPYLGAALGYIQVRALGPFGATAWSTPLPQPYFECELAGGG